MSYGPQTRNPWEDDTNETPDDERFPCACGDAACWGVSDDPHNLNLGGVWYAADCETGKRLEQIADGRECQSKADVARDDDFDQVRR